VPPVRSLIIRVLAQQLRGMVVVRREYRDMDQSYEHRGHDDRLN
jgi:hypothetical protein